MDFHDYVALYVINPYAGSIMLDHSRAVAELIRNEFAFLKVFVTSSLDELRRVVTNSHDKCEIIICAGGDGSINRVLNYMDRENQILGIVPTGSGNDIARNCGYSKNSSVKDMADRLLMLTPQPTDYCSINNHLYLNSGGFGYDATSLRIRERTPNCLKSNYFILGGLAALTVSPVKTSITTNKGYKFDGDTFWVLGMNNKWIGNGMPITPLAKIDDGLLDMFILKSTNRVNILLSMNKVWSEKHLSMSETKYLQCESFVAQLEDKTVDYLALDGELYPTDDTRFEFKCHHNALQLLR